MKKAMFVALLLGLVALTLVVVRAGAASVIALLSRSGWLLMLMIALHSLPLLPDAVGWRALIDGEARLSRLYWIATVRQAVNRLLPVASIGGELVGIRLLVRGGVGRPEAVASVIVEVFITLVGEFLFVITGVLCLLSFTGAMQAVHGIVIGLAATLPAVLVLALLLRHGTFFEWLHRAAAKLFGETLAGGIPPEAGARLDGEIRVLSRSYGRQLRALLWQFCGMLVGCLETYCALRWFAPGAGLGAALILESLSQAARHVLFIVPAGVGVQELSFIGVGHLLGIAPDAALALSLAKRGSEIVFGVPALLSWQWGEGRRLFGIRKQSA